MEKGEQVLGGLRELQPEQWSLEDNENILHKSYLRF